MVTSNKGGMGYLEYTKLHPKRIIAPFQALVQKVVSKNDEVQRATILMKNGTSYVNVPYALLSTQILAECSDESANELRS